MNDWTNGLLGLDFGPDSGEYVEQDVDGARRCRTRISKGDFG